MTGALVSDNQLAAVRAEHPEIFGTPWQAVKKWAPWGIALVYLVWSLWFFEIGRFLTHPTGSGTCFTTSSSGGTWTRGSMARSMSASRRRWRWPFSARFWGPWGRCSSAFWRRAT